MRLVLALLLGVPALVLADEKEIQRALIERDRQSAEFSNRSLERFHAREFTEPRPGERFRQARSREAELLRPPPPGKSGSDPDLRPLPLPGGPRHGVDPIPAQGSSGG